MALSYRFTVNLPTRRGAITDLPGFLDMLRYDRAVVVTWDHYSPSSLSPADAAEGFRITLEASHPPTVDRWTSFGLYPRDDLGRRLSSNGITPYSERTLR